MLWRFTIKLLTLTRGTSFFFLLVYWCCCSCGIAGSLLILPPSLLFYLFSFSRLNMADALVSLWVTLDVDFVRDFPFSLFLYLCVLSSILLHAVILIHVATASPLIALALIKLPPLLCFFSFLFFFLDECADIPFSLPYCLIAQPPKTFPR